jgi:elongation factor 1-alpha
MHHQRLPQVTAGDFVGIHLKSTSVNDIHRGFIIGEHRGDPPVEVVSFVAAVHNLNCAQLHVGYTPIIYCHTAHAACTITRILSKNDRKSGAKLEDNPKEIKRGEAGDVRFEALQPICLEKYDVHRMDVM